MKKIVFNYFLIILMLSSMLLSPLSSVSAQVQNDENSEVTNVDVKSDEELQEDESAKSINAEEGQSGILKETGQDQVEGEPDEESTNVQKSNESQKAEENSNLVRQRVENSNVTDVGSVSITKTNRTSQEPRYTIDNHVGNVAINGDNLKGNLEGPYVDVTVPKEHIDNFTVPPANFITKVETIESDDTITKRVYINNLTSTTSLSFPFNVKFKNKSTPDGYTINPDVALYTAERKLVGEATGELKFTTKYDKPEVRKYVSSNNDEEFSADGNIVHAGKATENNAYISENGTIDVVFQYRMSTTIDRHIHSFNPRYNQIRSIQKITITDVLPTYKNDKGETVTAKFSPEKNPGWVDNGDGTVSKVIDATEADKVLSNEKLVLTFPGAPLKTNLTNNVKVKITPPNMQDYEQPIVLDDDIRFRLSADPNGDGSFRKSNNDYHRLRLDLGANHLVGTDWTLNFVNKTQYPMKNVVITDGPYDNRYYMHSARFEGGLKNQVKAVYAVTADGEKISIPLSGDRVPVYRLHF